MDSLKKALVLAILLYSASAFAQPNITGTTKMRLFDGTNEWIVDASDWTDYILTGWIGSGDITTVGTITNGIWNGTAIAHAYIAQGGATTGQVLKWNGTAWAPGTDNTGGGGGGGGAPTDAQYLVLSADATLTDERVLTEGQNVKITDAGAGAAATVDVGTEDFALTGEITPTTITTDQDNYTPTGHATASVFRLNVTSTATMSGIFGGYTGRVLIVKNVGSADLILPHNSTSSDTENRFSLPGSTSITLSPKEGAQLWYDNGIPAWTCVGIFKEAKPGVEVYSYETAQTDTDLTIPDGVVSVEILCVGGGGPGGSGRKGAAGTVRCGGGGGGAGAVSCQTFSVAEIGASTLRINLPAAAAGGAAQTANSTNGNGGSTQTETRVGLTDGTTIIKANGGTRGNGGTVSNGTAGTAPTIGMFLGGAGAAANTSGGLGGSAAATNTIVANGGGAGGGISSANVANNGGNVGVAYLGLYTSVIGGTVNNNGLSGNAVTAGRWAGQGGSGGGASITGNAGNGGNGSRGGGGGGGGAALDSVGNSGAGGDGGIGYVRITFFY